MSKKNSPSDLTYLVMIHILKFELKESSLNKGLEFSFILIMSSSSSEDRFYLKMSAPIKPSKYEAFPMGTFNSF